MVVDERADVVYVRVLVAHEDPDRASHVPEYLDCPVRTWLKRPLADRAVIDFDSDAELPLYTPAYLNNVPQGDHGYRPAN